MTIFKKTATDERAANHQSPKQYNALDDVIMRAGGVDALSRSLGVTPQTVKSWQKQGALPWIQAVQLQYLYGTNLTDHICDEDALFQSLMRLERTLIELNQAAGKALQHATHLVDVMFEQRKGIVASKE
jgi:hypothetical protein